MNHFHIHTVIRKKLLLYNKNHIKFNEQWNARQKREIPPGIYEVVGRKGEKKTPRKLHAICTHIQAHYSRPKARTKKEKHSVMENIRKRKARVLLNAQRRSSTSFRLCFFLFSSFYVAFLFFLYIYCPIILCHSMLKYCA